MLLSELMGKLIENIKLIIMRVKYIFIVLFFCLFSCSTKKSFNGNYYCTCYFDFYPFSVIKIKNGSYELYSANIMGEKYIGKSVIKEDVLFLYRTYDIKNNFKDTIVSQDTAKYFIKGRKLIPFENEKCFYKKTRDKAKLFQMPYFG